MIVVSDASPLIGLSAVGHLDLLRRLYDQVTVPEAVFSEVTEPESGRPGAEAVSEADWIRSRPAADHALIDDLQAEVDAGEAEAIALAVEVDADVLLIDERRGRALAARMGLERIGVLGVLVEAKRKDFLPAVEPVLEDLVSEAGFRISAALHRRVLEAAGE